MPNTNHTLDYLLRLVRQDEEQGAVSMEHADRIRDELRAMTAEQLVDLKLQWKLHKLREIMGHKAEVVS